MVLARDRTGRIQVRSTLIQATGKRPYGVTTNTNQASISKSHLLPAVIPASPCPSPHVHYSFQNPASPSRGAPPFQSNLS